MAKDKVDIKRLLRRWEFDIGILEKTDCTEQENAAYAKMLEAGESLPEGIQQYKYDGTPINEFYVFHDPGLTPEEKQEVILFQQYRALRTIKNCVIFFTALTVLGIIVSFLALV